MKTNSLEEFEARHCTCDDDDDAEIASELVFTLMNGRLHVDAFGKGAWPNVSNNAYCLTKEATTKLLQYLSSAE